MSDSTLLVTAWLTGTTPVALPNSFHVYNISAVRVLASGVNGSIGTNLIIKDGSGNTVLTLPITTTTALLGSYTGMACDVPDFYVAVPVVETNLTAQLSANLTSGQIGIIVGTNKAN